jgi:hypothetical protein
MRPNSRWEDEVYDREIDYDEELEWDTWDTVLVSALGAALLLGIGIGFLLGWWLT